MPGRNRTNCRRGKRPHRRRPASGRSLGSRASRPYRTGELRIQDFESRQRDGANALVDAIIGAGGPAASTIDEAIESGSRAPVPAPHFLSKRPQVLAARDSSAVSKDMKSSASSSPASRKELRGNSQRATEREAIYASAADQLLDTQQSWSRSSKRSSTRSSPEVERVADSETAGEST